MAALAISDLKKFLSVFRKYRLTAIWTRHIVIWSRPERGALRNVTKRGAGCGGRGWRCGRRRLMRTEKSCGPDTPTLVSSLRKGAQATVTKKPGTPGRARDNP